LKILVVDDEKGFTEIIGEHLAGAGFEVGTASGGAQALDMLKGAHYDLVVLDVMMPGIDGTAVLQSMRKSGDRTPVIFLTARAEEADRIKGLKTGADDYVTKPFSMGELLERIRAILRRSMPGSDTRSLKIGKSSVDFEKLLIVTGKEKKEMAPHEASILRLLASEPGRIFSRDEILDRIWGMEAFPSNRTVDNYIVKLRQKIEPDPGRPRYIHTVYGAGYKLDM
jgi:DNA-binding response OmpR family regulator